MHLEKKIAEILTGKKLSLSVAESCSGGLLSHRITNVPGSSNFFKLGLVTYSSASKSRLLKIPSGILEQYGAVSSEVAEKMAQGVRKLQKTDLGIGITGIAGPTGGSKKKPVGLTYIAVSTKLETLCMKCLFKGSREQIKSKSTTLALKILLEFLD